MIQKNEEEFDFNKVETFTDVVKNIQNNKETIIIHGTKMKEVDISEINKENNKKLEDYLYYSDYAVELYHGDCKDILPLIKEKYPNIDLLLTDPPYGIDAGNYKRAGTQYGNSKAQCKDYGLDDWDKSRPEKEIFDMMLSMTKNQIIFGGNYYIDYLQPTPCMIVWDKMTGQAGYADAELAWTSFKSAVRTFRFMWSGMLQGDMKNKCKRVHPTQKPIQLMEWCLYKYAKKEQIVLDPYSGSGTTAVACKKLGIKCIAIEILEKYCLEAKKRLIETSEQYMLDLLPQEDLPL